MAKNLHFYKNLSLGLIIAVVALAGGLAWQVSQTTMSESKAQDKTQLVLDYYSYNESYNNMKESDAIAKAKADGFNLYRIAKEDGKAKALTGDFNQKRINFDIVDGKVTKVEFY